MPTSGIVIDLPTVLSTVIAGLLLAVIIGGFVLRDKVTQLAAEFRAFRFEVVRYMEAHPLPVQPMQIPPPGLGHGDDD